MTHNDAPPSGKRAAVRYRRSVPARSAIAASLAIGLAGTLFGVGSSAGATTAAGVPAGTTLTSSGDIVVSKDGTVIDGKNVTGSITIKADNVTVKRTRVRNGGYYAIRIASGSTGTRIEDTSVECLTSKGNGVAFDNYVASRVDVRGCKNAFLVGANASVYDSLDDGVPVGTATAPAVPTTTAAPTTTTAPSPTTSTTMPAPTTTTTASPATTSTTVPTSVAAPSSFPGASSTGYKSCGLSLSDLRPLSGTISLRDGAVLENFDLQGQVSVTGSNVTIRCGRIRTGAAYGIVATRNGGESFTARGVEIEGVSASGSNSAGVGPYGSWTLDRVNVWRFRDGIKLGSNQTVQYSWIHDLWKVDGAHNDGMQSVGGRNVRIIGNNIEGPWRQSTSALILGAGTGGFLEDYVISGNRLSGGGYTVYIGGKDGNPTPQNIQLTNNTWVRGSNSYGYLSTRLNWPANDGGAVISGNVYDDGTPIRLP